MLEVLNDILKNRPIIFDGAMGTMLDSSGARRTCNEELCLENPDVVAKIHRSYFSAGADIAITNTFGGSRIALMEHGLENKMEEINRAAVKIARAEAVAASKGSKKCFVAGELGPTAKLPTLGHISFKEMFDAYCGQALVLLESGVDLIAISTSQDILQTKAAVAAAISIREKLGMKTPIIASITVERIGTMLLGTEVQAALAALMPYEPFAFGLNCSTGPGEMEEHLKVLSSESPFHITCRPNAGMPENIDGKAVYNLGADDFAKTVSEYVRRYGVSIVGGCCGTTPDHIAALIKHVRTLKPTRKIPKKTARISSLFSSIDVDQNPKPLIIAEQLNVNGSKKFKDLLLKSDFDAIAAVAKEAALSSHVLDICLAFAGRDESKDLVEFVRRIAVGVDAAIMIDSTNPKAILDAICFAPGRSIINSINLEDGGKKADEILRIAKRHGAMVVCLTIDELGMAKTPEAKLGVAKRLIKLAESHGLSIDDLLIDPLTFTLASGDEELKSAGIQTLSAIQLIKKVLPGGRISLGVSNISFGLPVAARKALTSVFLHEAIEKGLDAAIIKPSSIVPLHSIPDEDVRLCKRLIQNDRSLGDPLLAIIDRFSKESITKAKAVKGHEPKDPKDELYQKIFCGDASGIDALISRIVEELKPKEIVSTILLPAMDEVGRLFGKGKVPLPFVLQSAEAMRKALSSLSPLMGSEDGGDRGTIVLATVRGDVHDIGKNLVDAILSNNGFRVINLGIRQPASAIIEVASKTRADAIGLSGLLVSSTEVMREDLELFRRSGIKIPVLAGGAALTSSYVSTVLAKSYGGPVHYCGDAFSGLAVMDKLTSRLKR